MLTGVKNFLDGYRDGSRFQKTWRGLKCSDTEGAFALAGFYRTLQPRRAQAVSD